MMSLSRIHSGHSNDSTSNESKAHKTSSNEESSSCSPESSCALLTLGSDTLSTSPSSTDSALIDPSRVMHTPSLKLRTLNDNVIVAPDLIDCGESDIYGASQGPILEECISFSSAMDQLRSTKNCAWRAKVEHFFDSIENPFQKMKLTASNLEQIKEIEGYLDKEGFSFIVNQLDLWIFKSEVDFVMKDFDELEETKKLLREAAVSFKENKLTLTLKMPSLDIATRLRNYYNISLISENFTTLLVEETIQSLMGTEYLYRTIFQHLLCAEKNEWIMQFCKDTENQLIPLKGFVQNLIKMVTEERVLTYYKLTAEEVQYTFTQINNLGERVILMEKKFENVDSSYFSLVCNILVAGHLVQIRKKYEEILKEISCSIFPN